MILKSRQFSHFFPHFFGAFAILYFSACGSGTDADSATGSDSSALTGSAVLPPTEPSSADSTSEQATGETENILFFGDSLTAGLGLDSPEQAYPALIQQKIDSLGLPYHCMNAGLSGETSAGGLERIDWVLREPVSIFVLGLGANDGLRGLPPEATFTNLEAIINKVLKANPDCQLVLAGMKIPPSMGLSYFTEFEAVFPRLAEKHDMTLIPFLLDQVAGIEQLNQSDGVHPTAEGQRILAENVWTVLEPLLTRP